MIDIDFPFILTLLTFSAAVILLLDKFVFAKRRYMRGEQNQPMLTYYAKEFFWVLLVVWVIRSFIAQPFVVPTGSLKPTVMPGDFVIVTQFPYGLRLPVWDKVFLKTGTPQRGDVVVVHWPVSRHVDFVKRVIGVPGDHISYINKVLYVNGKEMTQKKIGTATDTYGDKTIPVNVYEENFEGIEHKIYRAPEIPANNFYNLIVPKGEYFLMGDNRDNSDDSRDWGFVPANDLVGEGVVIAFSWDGQTDSVRWDRIGNLLR